jgi:hypothetical protein
MGKEINDIAFTYFSLFPGGVAALPGIFIDVFL